MKSLILILLITFSTNLFAQEARYVGRDHYNAQIGKFFNPGVRSEKGFWNLLKWLTKKESCRQEKHCIFYLNA